MDLGWVGVTQVGSENFQVDSKAEINWDYRVDIRESMSLKLSDRLSKN